MNCLVFIHVVVSTCTVYMYCTSKTARQSVYTTKYNHAKRTMYNNMTADWEARQLVVMKRSGED